MSKKRKKQHRSPVPSPQKTEWTPNEVMEEFRYVQALVKSGYDKVREENEPLLALTSSQATISADHSQQLLAAANNGLLDSELYEINERMVHQIHGITAVRRDGLPLLEQQMMPCRAGYVFFDALWPDAFPRTFQPRSLSWVLTTVESVDHGIVPALHVIVYGPFSKMGMFADVLPLGEQYQGEFYKHRGKGMRQLGNLVWAVWMMLGSELAATRQERYDRRRVPKPLRNISHGQIHVVTLRRRRLDGEVEHRDIDWQCSWWVSGHYRHLEKYDGPHHKAFPSPGDREICFNCGKRITHIGGYIKDPAELGTDSMKGTAPTIHKLVR